MIKRVNKDESTEEKEWEREGAGERNINRTIGSPAHRREEV